jgi:hypothetical protein
LVAVSHAVLVVPFQKMVQVPGAAWAGGATTASRRGDQRQREYATCRVTRGRFARNARRTRLHVVAPIRVRGHDPPGRVPTDT